MKRIYAFMLALCILLTAALAGCSTAETTVLSTYGEDEYIDGGNEVIDDNTDSSIEDSGENDASSDKDSSKDESSKKEDYSKDESSKKEDSSKDESSKKEDSSKDESSKKEDSSKDESSKKEDSSKDESSKKEDSSKDESSKKEENSKNESTQEANPNATTKEEYEPYKNMTDKDKKATVRIMTHWKLSDAEQAVLDDFTDKYGTKIKVVNVTLSLYSSKLASMVASGDAPDLCEMSSENFPTAIINNLVEPISKGAAFDLKKDPELDIRQMDAFKWKGQYYGLNLRNNLTYTRYCIYFNETMFNNRGVKTPYKYWKEGKWNWDTFADLAKKMTFEKNGKKVYGYSGEDTEQQGFLLAAGVDFVTNNNGKITNNLKNQKLIKVLQGISELRANGYWNPEDKGTGPFMQGLTAMCGSRTWLMEKNQDFTTKMTDKWGAVPMPSPAGQKEIVGISPNMWCIAKGAKNPDAASYVIRYWLDYDNWNINDVIADKRLLEVFNYMNETDNAMATISQGVTGYDDGAQYYKLIYTTRNSKNDIPVTLEKAVPTIDGIIKRLSK